MVEPTPDIPAEGPGVLSSHEAISQRILVSAEEIQRILNAADTISTPEIESIPSYMDSMLSSGQSPIETEAPEQLALDIYRIYAAKLPRHAANYLAHFLELATHKNVLHEQAILMFCSALKHLIIRNSENYRERTFTADEWTELALKGAEKKIATTYSDGGRVALVGAFLTLTFLTADDSPAAAQQLEMLCSTLEKTLRQSIVPGENQEKVKYFLPHLLGGVEQKKWPAGSPLGELLQRMRPGG